MDAVARAEEFRRRLDAAAEATEAALDALLAPATLPGEIARPARLLDAMRYSSLGGGKRLRPFLVIEFCATLRRRRRSGVADRLRARNDSLLFPRP